MVIRKETGSLSLWERQFFFLYERTKRTVTVRAVPISVGSSMLELLTSVCTSVTQIV